MAAEKNTVNKKKHLKNDQFVRVLLCAFAIPLSMSQWINNIIYSKFLIEHEEPVVISPARWLASVFIPVIVGLYAYKKGTLNLSGALLGILVAFVLTLSNFSFLVSLFAFFLSSSKATKYKSHFKKKIEVHFKEGGQRSWVQVLCNAGMATQLGLLYLLDVGASEKPVDFGKDYRASWLSMGVLGAFACCNGDTWASELGTVLSKSDPFLITSFKRVPKRTYGGISLSGTLCSIIGGLFIGLSQYLTMLYFADKTVLMYAPPQWPMIVFGAFAGFLGTLINLFLEATLTYSGLNAEGKIVSQPDETTVHVSGRNILNNHSVNLISTVIMGVLTPTISKSLWHQF